MSAGEYDAPHMLSQLPRFEPRRASGGLPASYDRPINAPARHRSPSPGPSRRPYDSYLPHRSDSSLYRGGAPNVYRPNTYRPEYSNGHFPSSSPDMYGPPRGAEPSWDRAPAWRPPPPSDSSHVWPERKVLPPSPTTSNGRGRLLKDDASTRMFEPSDTWKQAHDARPGKLDNSSPDRYFDRRSRASSDASPDRLSRSDRAPAFIPGGDRYRPGAPQRDSYPPGRSDSFRPYESEWSPRRDPISPVSGHFRRDSGSFAHTRPPDRHESSHAGAGAIARKPSSSMVPLASSMARSPDWISHETRRSTPSIMDIARREPPPRLPSRSSIASTHVSERGSPAIASIPKPSIPLPASLPPKPMTFSESVASGKLKDKAESSKPEPKSSSNGVRLETQTSSKAHAESKDTPPIVPVVNKSTPTVSIKSNGVTHIKQESVLKDDLLVKARSQSPKQASRVGSNGVKPHPPPNANSLPPPAPPSQANHITPEPSPSITIEEPVTNGNSVLLEIQQPKPLPPLERERSTRDILDLNIPPNTHSPSLSPFPTATNDPDPLLAYSNLPRPDEIPALSEAKSKEDALRIVVMTRMLRDHQTRDARVNPVLMANLSVAPPTEVHPTATPESLIDKMFTGQCLQARLSSAAATRPTLALYFEQRQSIIDDKVARLREEYHTLHERWVAHCNTLNDQQKNLASEQENHPSGRATRRSAAITDAVRSDFEMEQIIATLGNEDATDPIHLSLRNLAKVPDMISTVNGKVEYVFDDTSNLVENPTEYFAPHTGIDDWTDAEKQIFSEKFGAFPKQFGIIADYLPNKTAAQCVEYYYLHKKRFIDFRKVVSQYAPNKRKRRGMGRKKGNGLLADIAMHDMEVNRGSGAMSPSSIANSRPTRGRRSLKETAVVKPVTSSRRNAVQFEDTPTSTPTPEPDAKPKRKKAAAAAATPTASASAAASRMTTPATAAPSTSASTPAPTDPVAVLPSISAPAVIHKTLSTATTVDDEGTPDSEPKPTKRPKRTRKIKSAVMVAEEPASPPRETDQRLPPATGKELVASAKKPTSSGQWSEEDKKLFISLLAQYGDDFKRIAASMPFKTTVQVTNFYKSNLVDLNLAEVSARAPKRSPTPELGQAWMELPFSGVNSSPVQMLRSTSSLMGSRSNGPTPPMSSLSYDPSKNVYPPSSKTGYSGTPVSRDVHRPPPWTSPPLPTRMPQRPNYPLPHSPSATLGGPPQSHRHPPYSPPPPPRTAPNPYPYRVAPDTHASYGPNTNPSHPSRNPNSQSGPPTTTSPTLPTRSSQAYLPPSRPPQDPTRPRSGATPMYTSSPPLPPLVRPAPVYTPTPPPAPNTGTTAIVHSPTIPSPQLPFQTPYGHMSDYPPHPTDSRGNGTRYPSGSPVDSRSGWGAPASHRFFNSDGSASHTVGVTPYGGPPRGASASSGDGKAGGRRDKPYVLFKSSRPPQWPNS